jgi:Domain of unknown function (DUF1942)
VDAGGAVVQGWTVNDLRPSSDVIAYPVRGRLWEAPATDFVCVADLNCWHRYPWCCGRV